MGQRREQSTAIYLVCFHSVKRLDLAGSQGQFDKVERAIRAEEWPYDNGDDPSFYVARRGGPLTWGVCRQEIRNAIPIGSIVVFFSFTPLTDSTISYRLCAVETVIDKVDHRAIYDDSRFENFRHLYINRLISPEDDGWRHDEGDRGASQRHKDWLWRITDHGNVSKEAFDRAFATIYRCDKISNGVLTCGELRFGTNYVLFSPSPDRAFISPNPPEVARAMQGQHEKWIDKNLQALTVGKAKSQLKTRRDYLRAANRSGRNVHRQIRFDMSADEASRWRDQLIHALKAASQGRVRGTTHRTPAIGAVKC